MTTPGEPIDLPALVVLLYRADWTRLSLSAAVHRRHDQALRNKIYNIRDMSEYPPGHEPSDAEPAIEEARGRILLAPGGRYRDEVTDEDGPGLTVCDGETRWVISEGIATRRDAGGPPYPLGDLLTPSWLLTEFDLDLTGTSVVGGRTACRVIATPRSVVPGIGGAWKHRPDQAFALVDAELGILLSYEEVFDGRQLKITELTDLLLDPPAAAEPSQFLPPAGMPVRDDGQPGERAADLNYAIPGVLGQVARLVAGPAAAAVGFAARHAPVRSPGPPAQPDDEPGMPGTGRATDRAQLMPVTDDLVTLLYRSGLPPQAFTAEVHEWIDGAVAMRMGAALRARLPPFVDGIFGPDQLWDALGDRFPLADSTHRITRLTVAMPGRYRIDHLAGARPHEPATIACDGERLWKVYPNRVATGPGQPLTPDYARLADQSYLLSDCELATAGDAEVDGRRGFLVVTDRVDGLRFFGRGSQLPGLSEHVEVVLDAELGIALRETTYFDGEPVSCIELRHVSAQVDPGAFRIEVGPGTRTVGAGPLSDVDLPGPLKAAKGAVVLGTAGVVAGAIALTGWLQKRPAGQQPPPRQPPPGDS
jgi:outer membrane lipoprotein-sorting protein